MKTIITRSNLVILAIAFGVMACTKITKFEYFVPLFPDVPSVVTYAPEEVTTNTAELSGRITYSGGGNIIESGIHIYESGISPVQGTLPTTGFAERRYSDLTSEGGFLVFLADLKPNSTYHYRAFATNEAGTTYGEMKILVTSYGTVSDKEGNQYQTIKIGNQVWMRENLKSGKYPDGTSVAGNCDSPDNLTLGRHYTWQAAKGVENGYTINENVCPDGWHLPSDPEWKELLTYTGIPSDQLNTIGLIGTNQATSLKESGSNFWLDERIDNSTGFSVLSAGICSAKEETGSLQAAFWTSTPYIYYGFQNGTEKIMRGNDPLVDDGFSVRCVKD
jgi:uncharacterized protein (TIGR02145 family)